MILSWIPVVGFVIILALLATNDLIFQRRLNKLEDDITFLEEQIARFILDLRDLQWGLATTQFDKVATPSSDEPQE